jgi:hypothetical protein
MERIGGIRVVIELNDESLLTDVGWDALQLKSLEHGPVEKFLVGGGEFPETLDHVLVVVAINWLLLSGRELGGGMLADVFV